MQGNPPPSDENFQDHHRTAKSLMSDRSSPTMTKGLKVTSSSPSRLPKGFKTQSLPREDLTPPIKGRIKPQQISTTPKTVEPVIASGVNRDPCTDVIYLKQMLQASINRLQEMENDKHERYERWKQEAVKHGMAMVEKERERSQEEHAILLKRISFLSEELEETQKLLQEKCKECDEIAEEAERMSDQLSEDRCRERMSDQLSEDRCRERMSDKLSGPVQREAGKGSE